MKLSELNKKVKAISNNPDPEIKVVTQFGFNDIIEINLRENYYDNHPAYGNEYKKGNFICLEIAYIDEE